MSFVNVKSKSDIDAERLERLSVTAKEKRNKLLLETDYLVMPDYPSTIAGIKEYRQALRDITAQEGFPESIEWPVKP